MDGEEVYDMDEAPRSEQLRRRQQFQDELARTKEKLSTMPQGWERRAPEYPPDDGLTVQFWIGVVLLIGVIGLILWGFLSPEIDDDFDFDDDDPY